MRRRWILFGIFLTGALVMGAGGGIAFGEYSSFRYLGTKEVGHENMVTETIEVTRDPQRPFAVYTGGWGSGELQFLTDNTVPDDRLIFEVEYNEEAVTPAVDREETVLWEETSADGELPGAGELPPDGDPAQGDAPRIREDFILWSSHDRDFAALWACKDEILSDLKKRSFRSYELSYWGDVTVRMSETAAAYLED